MLHKFSGECFTAHPLVGLVEESSSGTQFHGEGDSSPSLLRMVTLCMRTSFGPVVLPIARRRIAPTG